MLRQYCILTSCLSDLKASNLPAIDKLKLEVQIIRTKRILLDQEVADRVMGRASSEQAFIEFSDHVRSLCSSSCTDRRTDALMSHLDAINDGLGPSTSGGNNKPLEQIGFGSRVLNAVKKSTFLNRTYK